MVQAFRRLRAAPWFALFGIMTVAFGVAAPAATESLTRALLIPQTGARNPESIVNIYQSGSGGIPFRLMSLPDFLELRRQQRQLESVTAWAKCSRTWILADHARGRGACELVDGQYFSTLGVDDPAAGRLLTPQDDAPGAPAVIVISYRVWQLVFGGQPDVVGRTVRFGPDLVTVVGVAPAGFRGLVDGGLIPTDTWIPLSSIVRDDSGRFHSSVGDHNERWLFVKGRLRADSGLPAVAAEVGAIARNLDREHPIGAEFRNSTFVPDYVISRPWTVRRATTVQINEGAELLIGRVWPVLQISVLLVLVATCTSVASMTLARGLERRPEMATRSALGAGRRRLVAELAVESVLLCAAGGVLGLQVAMVFSSAVAAAINDLSQGVVRIVPELTGGVVAITLAAAFMAVMVAGIGPALQASEGQLLPLLGGADSSRVAHGWTGRRWLIGAQLGLSFVLAVAAAVGINRARSEEQMDGGIGLRKLGLLSVDFDKLGYGRARTEQALDTWLTLISGRPGVEAAAATSGLGIGIPGSAPMIRTKEQPSGIRAILLSITPGAFAVLDLPILRGRGLSVSDGPESEPVVVLSEDAANGLWGHTAVVGQRVSIDQLGTAVVVGITRATDTGSIGSRDYGGIAYAPLRQRFESRLTLIARASDTGASVLRTMGDTFEEVDAQAVIGPARTGLDVAGPSTAIVRGFASVAAGLAIFSAVVALVGLYGVLSYVLSVRLREMGLRVALGASPQRIALMLLKEGLVPVVAGLAGGTVLVVFLLKWSRLRRIPDLTPDYWLLAGLAVAFVGAAAVAGYSPVRRAMRTDPMTIMKNQ